MMLKAVVSRWYHEIDILSVPLADDADVIEVRVIGFFEIERNYLRAVCLFEDGQVEDYPIRSVRFNMEGVW